MASLKSIPLKLRSADSANVQGISVSDETYWTDAANQFLTDEYPTNTDKYFNSVTLSSATADSVGRYTNTFYEQPIGTHPASSLSVGTNTRTLYQSKRTAPYPETKKLGVGADSDGDFWEMDSASFLEFGSRLLETAQAAGEGPTVFRLGSSLPVGNYAEWIPSAFTDTAKSGDTIYKIYRGEEGVPLSGAPSTNPIKITNTFDVKEMSYDSCAEFCGAAMLFAQQETGVGDVQLRSSADGAPTDAGTWVSRGIALDTRNTTQNLQYSSTQYTSPQYSTTYSLQYTGQYTGLSFADVPTQYTGTRPTTYAGDRTYAAQYAGDRNYAAQYSGARSYATQYTSAPSQFTGTRNFGGSRNYAAQYTASSNFAGTRQFAGSREGFVPTGFGAQYLGQRSFNFVGQRSYAGFRQVQQNVFQNFTGIRSVTLFNPTNYASFVGANFAGPAPQPGNFVGERPGSPVPAQFAGVRFFPNQLFQPIPVPDQFAGVAPGSPVTQTFAGVRDVTVQYSGFREFQYQGFIATEYQFTGNFTGSRVVLGPSPGNFIGSPQQFLGAQPDLFVGQRFYNTPVSYSGQYTSATTQFSGTRQFAGDRNYAAQYVGTQQFSGTRQFAGSRSYVSAFAGSRNYAGQYAGDRTYAAQYAGQTAPLQFTGQVPTTYTGQYTAQYTGQYTTSYTSQYSAQYTGETIVALTETIETYTLYQRISL